ncbi:predicted protein [Lichtheimia corymbifera JMRC:FSU:9682]|uniref:Uncharacterized protein n=1 Tax=Lichtheimia corymbifera JMRC:FSU:9682 TaxID=1263082 RepID=A0A068RPP7_9FUNG|nr:predicted protein [Lichtheimia corymbifera JMRC:FSU:9682]
MIGDNNNNAVVSNERMMKCALVSPISIMHGGTRWISIQSDKYGCKIEYTKYAQFVKKVTGQSTPRQENGLQQGAFTIGYRALGEHSGSEIAYNINQCIVYSPKKDSLVNVVLLHAMLWHMS